MAQNGFWILDLGFWILERYVAVFFVQILDFGFWTSCLLHFLANIVLCSYSLGVLSQYALDAAVGLMLHGEVVILYR